MTFIELREKKCRAKKHLPETDIITSPAASKFPEPKEQKNQTPAMTQVPDYVGPWGSNVRQQLDRTAAANAAFSTQGWAEARQNRCMKPPGQSYPQYPPLGGFGFLYPAFEKEKNVMLGDCQLPGADRPFNERTGLGEGTA